MQHKPSKAGRPHDAAKRARILQALAGDPDNFSEIGEPPYNVAAVAEREGMDPANLRKTLLKLEGEGLVAREWCKVPVWNAIAGGHVDRRCLCFWNAATMERDRLAAQQWREGSTARSEKAFQEAFGRYASK